MATCTICRKQLDDVCEDCRLFLERKYKDKAAEAEEMHRRANK